ncbi:hypothetical protein SGO26_08115 [Cupriavidus metallidurans]|uniref:hypothetical protein n=1 Tax=Cupriavidus TaxID=106589 RepID=UPI0002EA94DF|nr:MULTISPECIES: hypothetical protein [Cupriavidus]
MSRKLKDLQSYGYLIDDSALCALSPIPVLPYQPIRGLNARSGAAGVANVLAETLPLALTNC